MAELLVSVGVLVLLVFLATQLVNSAATITVLGIKRMDADSQARQVFDRMAIDFAQMVKRTDVDYYVKNVNQTSQNDQIAFYSAVPGYYPSTGAQTQSPLSLVGYRVNNDSTSPAYNKLERLGKGLVWNGVSTTNTPVVFLPLTIASTWCQATISGIPSPNCTGTPPDPNYEVIGPQVFRFEYYYLIGPQLTDSPLICQGSNCTLNAWRGVSAIVVDIAVIDPRSKVLLADQDIATLNTKVSGYFGNFLADFRTDLNRPGKLLGDPFSGWETTLKGIRNLPSWPNGTAPRQALSGIRFYERYFYLTH